MRVQRDIPAPLIVAGVKKSNLRQLAQERLQEKGLKCRCIRCREIGHAFKGDRLKETIRNAGIFSTRYAASKGQELFISVENREKDVLIGYLRLRIPSEEAHRPEIRDEPCAIVRELHVYGSLVPVGQHLTGAWQHKGFGSMLLAEAEREAKEEHDLKKILVISALGTKQYYKRFGYDYDGVYMSKRLERSK
jgi:elongator complex protein 3